MLIMSLIQIFLAILCIIGTVVWFKPIALVPSLLMFLGFYYLRR